jgi:UDP-N-acetylglucosamine diphosphorylase/glucosamine-1-phosphate N-acetyltransferase
MSSLVLFDDAVAAGWKPFTWTRPAGELIFGGCTIRERAERVTATDCVGHVAPHLAGFDDADAAPVIDASSTADDARIYLSSRFVPDWDARVEVSSDGCVFVCAGEVVGCAVPAGAVPPEVDFFRDPANRTTGRRVDLAGRVLTGVWELVTGHDAQLAVDMDRLVGDDVDEVPAGVSVVGPSDAGLRIAGNVTIEPGVVIDCSAGPVLLEDGVSIRAFTRLAGPARIGSGTTLLGGTFESVVIGPHCKVRGELESSVVLGYSNKAHDGFIGHSVIGRWVNLGALTTNSDLKNNYGNVRITTPAGEVDTRSMKVGCFIGDHVKTAIGTMLNTGTVIGPGSNIFGGMPPKAVPPFSWGGRDSAVHDLERFLETATVAMGRRDVPLTPGARGILERAWQAVEGSGE